MFRNWVRVVSERLWLRVALAVVLLIVGLAPIGAPILSDTTFRQAIRPAPAPAATPSYAYRWLVGSDAQSRVQRATAGAGATEWRDLGTVPDALVQIEPVAANGTTLFARSQAALWHSTDGGLNWTKLSFPGRPMSLVAAHKTDGMLFAGSESLGLYRSLDNGATWQSVGEALFAGGAGALGVSAVSINPEDERVVYAAPGYWLGTTEVHFSPLGVFVSVNAGTTWFPMVGMAPVQGQGSAPTGLTRVTQLVPVSGKPLAVTALNLAASGAEENTRERRFELAATPEFVKKLDDPDRNVRAATARALGLSGNQSMVSPLLAHLHDEDLFAGDQVAEALGKLGNPAAVSTLMEALADPNEGVRARAAYGLGMLKAEAAVPTLAKMLAQDGPLARNRAAEALAAIGTPDAMSALVARLSDEELTPARHAAMSGLEKAGQPAIAPLVAALGDPSPAMRRNSAEVLGWLKPASATPQLAKSLADQDAGVREQAAWALGEIGTPEARTALAQAIRTENQADVKATAQQALVQAQQRQSAAPAPGEALMRALTQVPVTRWTFLALLIVLAAILVAASPRQLRLDRGAEA